MPDSADCADRGGRLPIEADPRARCRAFRHLGMRVCGPGHECPDSRMNRGLFPQAGYYVARASRTSIPGSRLTSRYTRAAPPLVATYDSLSARLHVLPSSAAHRRARQWASRRDRTAAAPEGSPTPGPGVPDTGQPARAPIRATPRRIRAFALPAAPVHRGRPALTRGTRGRPADDTARPTGARQGTTPHPVLALTLAAPAPSYAVLPQGRRPPRSSPFRPRAPHGAPGRLVFVRHPDA